jgi:hypothetical protein
MRSMLLTGVLVGLLATAAGADTLRVSARKVTLNKREGKTQDLPRGTTTYTAKDVGYRFTLMRLSPTLPETVMVEWRVLVEGAAGRLHLGTRGEQQAILPVGQDVEVETGPVHLDERTWSGRANAGSVESSIYGYGVRVLDAAGTVLYEDYQPAAVKSEIDWKPKESEPAPEPPPPRPRRRFLP